MNLSDCNILHASYVLIWIFGIIVKMAVGIANRVLIWLRKKLDKVFILIINVPGFCVNPTQTSTTAAFNESLHRKHLIFNKNNLNQHLIPSTSTSFFYYTQELAINNKLKISEDKVKKMYHILYTSVNYQYLQREYLNSALNPDLIEV